MKKSLFLGAAAVLLLVLFTFVGCSNPASDTEYVSQVSGDYPYPADTVYTEDYAAFIGLLNDYTAGTNGVRNIAYGGAIGEDTIIPNDKIVYLTADLSAGITGNITVRERAKLVLVGDFTAGVGGPGANLLLVRGQVEVFKSLKVTTDALDVADYTDENVVNTGRNTVIGSKVTVLPGAILTLDVTDLIPPTEFSANKFTPAQAWAAAGQGHLVIGTSGLPRQPDPTPSATYDYTVRELLVGVAPSPGRTYTVSSRRTASEVLPAVIPAGAYIATDATPAGSDGNTLTVNGGLTIGGTLADITQITLGNGGALALTQATGDILTSLESLTIGAGGVFGITSTTTTLRALDALTIKDGGSITVPGTNVTFNPDPEAVLAATLGKKVFYSVGTAPGAVVAVTLNDDASLLTGSALTINKGSTFTLAAGKTLTVEDGATLNLVNTIVDDTGIETPPIQINGAIVVADNGVISIPDPAAFTTAGDISTVIAYGPAGKVVLQKGAIAKLAATTYIDDTGTVNFVMGADSVIEISAHSWKISGGNVDLADDTTIIAADTLDIASGLTLTVASGKTLTLNAEGALGAKITGAGAVKADVTTISGGTYGWQAISSATGAAKIDIAAAASASSITADVATVSLTALGPGATITQAGGATNELTITGTAASTDGVINLSASGAIILKAAATTAAKITLPANALIKIGSGEGTVGVTNANLKIALKDTTDNIAVAADLTGKAVASGSSVLTQINGAAPTDNTITGPTPDTANDLIITANMPATGT